MCLMLKIQRKAEEAIMFKVEITETPETITLYLKGALRGPQVAELARVWEAKRAETYDKRFRVDLSEVSLVDQLGKEMLAVMHGHGTELLSTGPMMSAVIDEILACEHGTLARH
jgi:ABC-type transporter Mla MlaB component